MWQGVERVLIACDLDGVEPARRGAICSRILDEAGRLTDYPVSLATAETLDPRSAATDARSAELILHVQGSLSREDGADVLTMSVRPERLGFSAWRGPSTGPARIAVELNGSQTRLHGPMPSLAAILSEPKPGRSRLERRRSDRF
jgi:hypothetical protein